MERWHITLGKVATLKHGTGESRSTKSNDKDSYKVQLDFSGKNLDDLDKLKELTVASARAEAIRIALRWMFWCADEVTNGGTILVEREGKQREVTFPFVRKERRKTLESRALVIRHDLMRVNKPLSRITPADIPPGFSAEDVARKRRKGK